MKDAVVKYLKQLGHSVLDITHEPVDVNSDLSYMVSKANEWRAELFVSIRFNKVYNIYDGALGSEVNSLLPLFFCYFVENFIK